MTNPLSVVSQLQHSLEDTLRQARVRGTAPVVRLFGRTGLQPGTLSVYRVNQPPISFSIERPGVSVSGVSRLVDEDELRASLELRKFPGVSEHLPAEAVVSQVALIDSRAHWLAVTPPQLIGAPRTPNPFPGSSDTLGQGICESFLQRFEARPEVAPESALPLLLGGAYQVFPFFEAMEDLSARAYEHAEAAGRVAFDLDAQLDQSAFSLTLIDPPSIDGSHLRFGDDRKAVRKLLAAASTKHWLVVQGGRVVGLAPADLLAGLPRVELEGRRVWQLRIADDILFRVEDGIPRAIAEPPRAQVWSAVKLGLDDNGAETTKVVPFLLNEATRRNAKGAVFVFMPAERIEELLDTRLDPRSGGGPSCFRLCSDTGLGTGLGEDGFLRQVGAVDGAVLLDLDLRAHAFGVVLDGLGSPQAGGDRSRGARYNSTRRFVADCLSRGIPCCAAVFSDDGGADLFPVCDGTPGQR